MTKGEGQSHWWRISAAVALDAADRVEETLEVLGALAITRYHQPGGPGVRVDSHIFNNYRVPPYYDSLIAKVITHGEDREQALQRMSGALREMVVDGIDTNIALQQQIVDDAAFRQQPLDIHYLERQLSS